MIDHDSGRTGSYALKDKFILAGNGWIQKRIVIDIDNAGHKGVNLNFERDREASIVALQYEVQRTRTSRSIPVNSPVGESESSGRVANVIRRAQDKVRTLKVYVAGETGVKMDNMKELMSWLVRWAGELITKYCVAKDGKTAQDRLKGQPSHKPLARFGEHATHPSLHAPATASDKIDDTLRPRVWFGMLDRTEEAIIGTEEGLTICRTVKRRPEGEQWSSEALTAMKGLAQQPVPSIQTIECPL